MTEPAPVAVVIPARGGSKRIPRKNVRPFLGVPLVARTIEMILRSGVADVVLVSTDDDEIAEVARGAGASVPFRRPAALADDHAPTAPVIAHAIVEVEAGLGRRLGAVGCVYPGAALTRPEDLRAALDTLRLGGVSYVVAATTYDAPVQRALRHGPDGRLRMLHPEHRATRTQDLEELYHDAGQFYWGTRDAWLAHEPALSEGSALHVLPRWRTPDIDTEADWQVAEAVAAVLWGRAPDPGPSGRDSRPPGDRRP